MLRVRIWGAALVTVVFSISGCSGGDTLTPETLPTLTPRPSVVYMSPTPLIQVGPPIDTPQATSESPAIVGDQATFVQGAINALATALNVPAPSISLVSVNAVQWQDSSLGCPQPGQAYVQAITPGYVIILKAKDDDYEVHVDHDQHYVVCMAQSNGGATATPPDPVAAEFIQQARVILAGQLSVSPDAVAVVSSEAKDWSDGNLGCKPQSPSTTPGAGPISGYKIVLAVGDKYYEYHTDSDRIFYCKDPIE